MRRYRGRKYQSGTTLFGLPLVHVNVGDPRLPDPREAPAGPTVAKGWIAIGDVAHGVLLAVGGRAYGLVACGGVALGLVSFGGLAVGGLALGGAALGGIAAGGAAVGGLAIGGGAVGWQAAGGAAVAWDTAVGGSAVARRAAFGGAAVARDFAVGGAAMAREANTDAAKAVILTHPLVVGYRKAAGNLANFVPVIVLACLLPVLFLPLLYRRIEDEEIEVAGTDSC